MGRDRGLYLVPKTYDLSRTLAIYDWLLVFDLVDDPILSLTSSCLKSSEKVRVEGRLCVGRRSAREQQGTRSRLARGAGPDT